MGHQSECAEDRGNVTETEKECAEAASPPREEMFATTQALQDEELELEEEKRAFAEKKKTERRSRKIDNHPIAKLLQELIPFADQGLAPLPRVIEEMRCMMCGILLQSCGSSSERSTEDIPRMGVTDETIEKNRRSATLMRLEGYRDAHAKRYLLHDIYTNGTGTAGEECALRLMAKLRTGTYCIASHGGHLHVLHTCDYDNSTCRCYITQVLRSRFGKWVARTCASSRNISFERRRSIAVYMSHGTRVVLKINHSGGDWVRGGENRTLPVHGSGERGSFQLVEGGTDPSSRSFQFAFGPGSTDDKTNTGQEGAANLGDGRHGKEGNTSGIGQTGTQRSHKGEQILNMIMTSAVTPLARFFDSHLWLESHYKALSPRSNC
ncbi:unnamed protein product [Bemisia tabaci]|uniref:Uncharacterized protein n=1 Tax=Bemisia tabaci TaxID=7038 RepID=A0A9P0ABA7_BEMTA|nr:unnamed protein product [Bemisia tabaci]